MTSFDEKHIKNIAIVGAHGCGKTTLTEAMVFEAGLLTRRGNVEDGTTLSDYHSLEQQKGMSIFTTLVHTEWRDYKINILDTPGLDDFIGEIIQGVKAADTIAMVINAKNGVEPGTEILWNYIHRFRKPLLFAINRIDQELEHFDQHIQNLREHFGNNVVQMQYPILYNGQLSIIDVLKMQLYVFPPDGGQPEKLPIPDAELEKATALHNELVEKAAENEESLMEVFFEKGQLTEEELKQGMRSGMVHNSFYPVFCVSALRNMGAGRLMGFIDHVAPSTVDKATFTTADGKEFVYKLDAPLAAFVFKTQFEPNVGKMNFVKVLRGCLKTGESIVDSETGKEETIHNLFIIDGNKRKAVNQLIVGDLGAVIKLKDTETNHTLYAPHHEVKFNPMEYPAPKMRKAISAESKSAEDKLSEVMKKIVTQDPTIHLNFSKELNQWIIGCQGDLHLTVLAHLLKEVYEIPVHFEDVRIAYRETIQKPTISFFRHKKQSGGAGQFAEVRIKVEPWYEGMPEPEGFSIRAKNDIDLEWGGKLVFYNCIVGGVIDARFVPSVLKGILESMNSGPLSGSYVQDVRVILFDGKMHPVDSNDIAFKIAGARAFSNAILEGQPKLLEPVDILEVWVPEPWVGDVMGELQTRRATIVGMDNFGKNQKIKARIPQDGLKSFSNSLRSLTQGRGTFSTAFDTFVPVAANLQEQIVKQHRQQLEAV